MTWPEVSASNPPRILINVVLPEPDGPISATHSPAWIFTEMPSKARSVPYSFTNDSITTCELTLHLGIRTRDECRRAAATETITVMATEKGYTIQRGCAATPNTAFPSQMDTSNPIADPTRPPTIPMRMASARNSRTTRRTDPPMAFIRPTSFLRSMATLLMPAITQSEVKMSTRITVAESRPLMRL